MSTIPSAMPFGVLPDGRPASLFKLENPAARVQLTDFGARMVSIEVPDGAGRHGHILLGFDDVSAYATAGGSFGALLGRFANRIAGGRFTLDGQVFDLATNQASNTLHGGPRGFGMLPWQAMPSEQANTVVFAQTSSDGDQGFPGKVEARATYTLEGATLRLTLEATTDRPTVINLSSHPYFNLAGVERYDVLDHEVIIHADHYLPTDQAQIPTGQRDPVEGTPFDFRKRQTIGAWIREAHPQLLIGRGYDHCFVLNGDGRQGLRLAAQAYDPVSARRLDVLTTQPGLQFYSGNSLNGAVVGRGGIAYRQSAGFALEAQNFPDAPNQPGFPSAVLRPNERYAEVIEYRFTAGSR